MFSILILAWTWPLIGQTNPPVLLALVAESTDATPVLDVLTADLSSHTNLQLLERNEVQKIYQEQALAANNQDFVKLGQMLGADGLLLMSTNWESTNKILNIRLVAVKTGVVLVAEKMAWPGDDLTAWSPGFARHIDLFLPKLAVALKDAIPISIVNLRSAVSSAESQETEQQLKLLLIQRLTREPAIFVLERQQMQLLGEEKELKQDDTAFWNGSYLLEGVTDQNGYSPDTITLNARLTPKGGTPILLEVSDNRTNLPDVINQLAVKVTAALNLHSDTGPWKTADEASQYLAEAKWALRWEDYAEAQTASESAWMLGRHDEECASVRIQSYAVPPDTGGYQNGESTGPFSTNEIMETAADYNGADHIFGLTLSMRSFGGVKTCHYVSVHNFPDVACIETSKRALDLYYQYGRNLPPDHLAKDHAWHDLGITVLVAASQVLQHFHFVLESQKPAVEKLAALRASARLCAKWIEELPAVHDSYFTGNRMVTYDALSATVESPVNLYRCETKWGCLWQDTPAGCLELYRHLMSSPVFGYYHEDLWFRRLECPRLAAWNDGDRKSLAATWENFLQELNTSTNVFMQMEAKALILQDAAGEQKTAIALTNFFEAFLANRAMFFSNDVEVLKDNWGADNLVEGIGGDRDGASGAVEAVVTPARDTLQKLGTEYLDKLKAKDAELQKSVGNREDPQAFENQKQYLNANQPFDFVKFVTTFNERDYSPAQALEILPLIKSYKANVQAQSGNATRFQQAQLAGAVSSIGLLETQVDQILHPSATPPVQPPRPQPVVIAPTSKIALTSPSEIATNVLAVDNFQPIPLDGLRQAIGATGIRSSRVIVTAHHWMENKLVLNFKYEFYSDWGYNGTGTGIAVFDPAPDRWEVVDCPKQDIIHDSRFYHRTALWHGNLFYSDDSAVKKYDRTAGGWQDLPVSDGNNYELFTVNDHLYAANRNIIFDILDDGKSTHILASTRRQPPASTLDTQGLGLPTLFEGPGHSLRVSNGSNIFTWDGQDWRENFPAPAASTPPAIVADGVIFRKQATENTSVSFLGTGTNMPELSLWQKKQYPGVIESAWSLAHAPPDLKPAWKMPSDLSLGNLAVARCRSDIYVLVDHSEKKPAYDPQRMSYSKIAPLNGYHATLLDFSPGYPMPQKVLLKFTIDEGCPPVTGADPAAIPFGMDSPPAWMLCLSNVLLCGLELPVDDLTPQNWLDPIGYTTGVWEISLNQIQSAFDGQKQAQMNRSNTAQAAIAREHQAAQDKYAHNNHGLLSSEEKSRALLDPAFIASELDVIDTNHNDRIDSAELAYFDANQNKVLEPDEQAGIELSQNALAQRLIKQFDADADGFLNQSEFSELLQTGHYSGRQVQIAPRRRFPDTNGDGKVDANELAVFLDQQTRLDLRAHVMNQAGILEKLQTNPGQPVDSKKIFKLMVESYWTNPDNGQ